MLERLQLTDSVPAILPLSPERPCAAVPPRAPAPFAPPPFTPAAQVQRRMIHAYTCTIDVPSDVSPSPGIYSIGVLPTPTLRVPEFLSHPIVTTPDFPGNGNNVYANDYKRTWYVVMCGFRVGVYAGWMDCKSAVSGAPGNSYKGEAETYLQAKQRFCDGVVNQKVFVCPYALT